MADRGGDVAAPDVTRPQAPVLLGSDEGEALWFNNDVLTIKTTGAQTGGSFLLVEELARNGKVTPLHLHPDEDETFYVLEGEVLLHVDGSDRRVGPGGVAHVPRGVPHAYLVVSDVSRALLLITPGSGAMESFFRDAGEPARGRELPPDGPLDIERIRASAERTGAVKILGPPPFATA
jgi:quercetin dioxygenase-like cupin family protein